jgi:mannonate dehydratase
MNRRRFFSATGAGMLAPLRAHAAAAPTPPPARMKVGCQEGPTTDEWLRFWARHGVRNICGSLPGPRPAGPYAVEELEKLRDQCAKYGVSLDMVRLHFLRPTSVDEDQRAAIVLGQSPERDRDIAEVQATIRNCHRAGVPALTYNLTILGYQRNHTARGRGGASQLGWRLPAPGAAGKPTRAGRVDADTYWERITYFLDRVVPVANEHKVRIACHPHDPPTPPGFRGVDAVLGTVEGLKRFVTIRESAYHGLNFCQGTVAEMLADPAKELFDVIRHFGRKRKIFNVHFRNIHGHRDEFEERFPDEGDIDFVKALKVYREVGYEHMLMPDHVPRDPDDPGKKQALAFCYGYIRGLLQASEG